MVLVRFLLEGIPSVAGLPHCAKMENTRHLPHTDTRTIALSEMVPHGRTGRLTGPIKKAVPRPRRCSPPLLMAPSKARRLPRAIDTLPPASARRPLVRARSAAPSPGSARTRAPMSSRAPAPTPIGGAAAAAGPALARPPP